MKISLSVRSLIATIAIVLASQANAAPTIQITAGKLTAASGIEIAGNKYTAFFDAGSCVDVLNGCTNEDLVFKTYDEAAAASRALESQVFSSGIYDTSPNLTRGCLWMDDCYIMTPYSLTPDNNFVRVHAFVNSRDESLDSIASFTAYRNVFPYVNATFVQWRATDTNVPEPSSIALLGLAMVGLAFSRRRKS